MAELTVNQRHARSIRAAGTNTSEVPFEELGTANLKAFLDHLRRELVHTVIRGPGKDVLYRAALIVGGTMLADVLNTPVTKLAMGQKVDFGQDFFNSLALQND